MMLGFWYILSGALLGVVTGLTGNELLLSGADETALVIKRLLELVSIPIIFLSITAAISGMTDRRDAAHLGLRTVMYTLLTTIIAAMVGLGFFLFISPSLHVTSDAAGAVQVARTGLADFFRTIVPNNLLFVLSSNSHVASVVFLALLLGFATLALDTEEKHLLHKGFSLLFSLMMQVTTMILYGMPIGVWAFTSQFVASLRAGQVDGAGLWWYVVTVLVANIVQGCVVLPLILLIKKLSPRRLFTAFKPALTTAFLSKSSNSTLPVTMQCAEKRAGISSTVSKFVLPLCATINMNGCAAFILITVMFVGNSYGIVFSVVDKIVWVLIATIAAVGNAGVPMGCFFLTSAFLAHLHLPLHLMGVILPVYALIDMVETALNVWSDSCVAAMVNADQKL